MTEACVSLYKMGEILYANMPAKKTVTEKNTAQFSMKTRGLWRELPEGE